MRVLHSEIRCTDNVQLPGIIDDPTEVGGRSCEGVDAKQTEDFWVDEAPLSATVRIPLDRHPVGCCWHFKVELGVGGELRQGDGEKGQLPW